MQLLFCTILQCPEATLSNITEVIVMLNRVWSQYSLACHQRLELKGGELDPCSVGSQDYGTELRHPEASLGPQEKLSFAFRVYSVRGATLLDA